MELRQRITVRSGQCGGKPCIRGMRIRVSDVLELLAGGLNSRQIVKQLPDLEPDDIRAALAFAAKQVDKRKRDSA